MWPPRNNLGKPKSYADGSGTRLIRRGEGGRLPRSCAIFLSPHADRAGRRRKLKLLICQLAALITGLASLFM
jgi:hypothetical protein